MAANNLPVEYQFQPSDPLDFKELLWRQRLIEKELGVYPKDPKKFARKMQIDTLITLYNGSFCNN